MPEYKCETCKDTGFYGDQGPGLRGNAEYQPCECRTTKVCNSDDYYTYQLNRWDMKNNMPDTRYITGIRLLDYVDNPDGTINQPKGYFTVKVGFATGLGNCSHWGRAYHRDMIYNPLTGNLSYPNGGGLRAHYANRAEAVMAVQIMTNVWWRNHKS